MPQLGTGITVDDGNGFFAEISNLSESGQDVPAIDVTHSLSAQKEYIPGALADWGQLEIEYYMDPQTKPPANGTSTTWTITFRDGTTWVRSGFWMTGGYDVPTGPTEDKIVGRGTLKFTGDLTVTPPPP